MNHTIIITLVSSAVIFVVVTGIYAKVMMDEQYQDHTLLMTAIYGAAVLLLGVSTYYYWRIEEGFELVTGDRHPQVRFLTKEETTDFLYNDRDGYVATMSPLDLYARQSRTPIDYCKKSAHAAADFTMGEQAHILAETKKVQQVLERAAAARVLPGLDFGKICYIPWMYAKTRGTDYEEGLPHSRAGIIFLNESWLGDKDLARTILHEKIHVYQRMYPEETIQYLESEGYTRYKQRVGEPRIRANPDLSPWLFFDKNRQTVMAAYYTSDTPAGIQDVVLQSPTHEDPYEAMAYELVQLLMPAPEI